MTPEERAENVQWGGRPLPIETRAAIAAAIRDAVAAAIERCAKICEATHAELDARFSPEGCTDGALVAADRIRATPNETAPADAGAVRNGV